MNMDYREPRNGDFASYVEELSRHFDLKAQAVNPDFTSRFPSGADSDKARKKLSASAASAARTSTAVASTKSKSSGTGNQPSTTGEQFAEQQDVKAPTAATTKPGTRTFRTWPLLILIVAGFIFLASILNPHHNEMDAGRNIGALVLQIVIVIYLIKYIRQVARFFSSILSGLFSTSDKPKKHI